MYEIIVADGCSTDDTVEIAQKYGCQVLNNPRQTVAGGRNVGIAAARGEYIAFTEDDIILPRNWISEGVHVLSDSSVAAVGGPTPIPASSAPFAKAVDLIFRAATISGYSVQSGVSGGERKVNDIPGGNAMYRKAAFGKGPPVDEGLITGEDVDLHFRLRGQGHTLIYRPSFLAWHHKRDTPGRFFNQIRRFAKGRIQVSRRHKGALGPMHRVTAIAPAFIIAFLVLSPLYLMIYAVAFGLLACVAIGLGSRLGIRASLWLPIAIGIFISAWSAGFLAELFYPTSDATGK